MIGGLQREEWKFIQKYLKENISRGVGGTEENSHHAWAVQILCECCASFAQASHKLKVLCEFRTSLEQLSSEGHIFLISAPNCTRFEALDSWLPELWNGIYHVENGLREVLQKFEERLQLLSFVFFIFSLLLFASLLCLACLNDPKSCQNTKTSHKYD